MPDDLVSIDPSEQAKVRCYGAQAALTAEATPLLVKGEPCGDTVNLEVAPRQGETFNWRRKITIQLSKTELPLIAAVCLGYLPNAHFKRPGKGIVIERQSNKLFISASQGSGNVFALPLPIGQTFQLACIILAQLQKQTELSDGALLMAALRGAAGLYKT
jgi:hypothetical protein